MISLILKPINSLFVVAWVKMNNISKEDLQLIPYNQHHQITNARVIEEMEQDFKNFRQSKLSMDEFFQTNILIAIRYDNEYFNLKKSKFHFTKVRLALSRFIYFSQLLF